MSNYRGRLWYREENANVEMGLGYLTAERMGMIFRHVRVIWQSKMGQEPDGNYDVIQLERRTGIKRLYPWYLHLRPVSLL